MRYWKIKLGDFERAAANFKISQSIPDIQDKILYSSYGSMPSNSRSNTNVAPGPIFSPAALSP